MVILLTFGQKINQEKGVMTSFNEEGNIPFYNTYRFPVSQPIWLVIVALTQSYDKAQRF